MSRIMNALRILIVVGALASLMPQAGPGKHAVTYQTTHLELVSDTGEHRPLDACVLNSKAIVRVVFTAVAVSLSLF